MHRKGKKRMLSIKAACRAKANGIGNLVECLGEPHHCQLALRFGHVFFCQHPQRMKIAARTVAKKS